MSAEAPWSARAPAAGIDGKLMENALPSFWSDALSRAFADTRPGAASGSSHKPDPGAGVIRRAEPATPADVRLRAKQLRAAGYSYGGDRQDARREQDAGVPARQRWLTQSWKPIRRRGEDVTPERLAPPVSMILTISIRFVSGEPIGRHVGAHTAQLWLRCLVYASIGVRVTEQMLLSHRNL